MGTFELIVNTHFAAAHNLRGYHGDCEQLHGHNWAVDLVLEADRLDELGMVLDFREVKRLVREVLEALDHRYLNDLEAFREDNPTTENIARYIHRQLQLNLPEPVRVKKVTAWESEGCGAAYSEASDA
jgi:6-pyruvoyltetrahydropterin/6-carboxytetrahydropterin synthase